MQKRLFKIFRGTQQNGKLVEYETEIPEGMVVLDAIHQIQATQAPDLGVRWNCKAGKCGSCSAEVNGKPKLMCLCRVKDLPQDKPITVSPLKAFPVIKDLVTDVSWNYLQNKRITKFSPDANTDWKMFQHDVDRVQEFRKCIECFLCQNVCHVLRTHQKHADFSGPRFFVRAASLDMHPLDKASRIQFLKKNGGLGLCNITKCCTEVCPEYIHITDNAIIPMKERVADKYYDPLKWLLGKMTGK
ncbi:MAG: succinate dehydrogenase/fumarate reductase iron-sulfur subunit [bacterium]